MQKNIVLTDLSKPAEMHRLKEILRDIYDEFDSLYSTTAINGVVSARRGKTAILYIGGLWYWSVNVDGDKLWKQVQIT